MSEIPIGGWALAIDANTLLGTGIFVVILGFLWLAIRYGYSGPMSDPLAFIAAGAFIVLLGILSR